MKEELYGESVLSYPSSLTHQYYGHYVWSLYIFFHIYIDCYSFYICAKIDIQVMHMRIIGGIAKGRKLASPKGMPVRPTADMVKEALFDILAPYIDDAMFLDLFAGSGSVGLEALSRGAKEVYFVDDERQCVSLIKHNLVLLNMHDKGKVILSDAIASMDLLLRWRKRFDIVFMDPPYERDYVMKGVKAVITADILIENGILVVQRSKREALHAVPEGWVIYKEKVYGDTILDFIRRI